MKGNAPHFSPWDTVSSAHKYHIPLSGGPAYFVGGPAQMTLIIWVVTPQIIQELPTHGCHTLCELLHMLSKLN